MEVIRLKTDEGEILLNVYNDDEKDYQKNERNLEDTIDLTKVVIDDE